MNINLAHNFCILNFVESKEKPYKAQLISFNLFEVSYYFYKHKFQIGIKSLLIKYIKSFKRMVYNPPKFIQS